MREIIVLAKQNNLFLKFNTIDIIIKYSEKLFIDLNSYNKFWRFYLNIIYYFLTPLNLVLLNMVFSLGLIFVIRMAACLFLGFSLIVNLVFNLSIASINN